MNTPFLTPRVTRNVSVNLSADNLARLDAEAERLGVTRTAIILNALDLFFAQTEKQRAEQFASWAR